MVVDLDDKDAILALRAQERLKGMNAMEMIQEFYSNTEGLPIELPPRVEEIRTRLNLAVRLQCKGLSRFNIMNKLRRVFDISEMQAYRDINNALKIFGDVQDTKEGKRVVVEEMVNHTFMTAKRTGNLKQMNAAISSLIKIHGLDKETTDKPDFSNLKQSVYVVVVDPQIHDMFMKLIDSGGSIDVSKFINNIRDSAEEISYTEA